MDGTGETVGVARAQTRCVIEGIRSVVEAAVVTSTPRTDPASWSVATCAL